jgi:hypothetical protein
MISAVRNFQAAAFFRRHPLLRDALLWAIPALVVGAALRVLFLSYSPYAYWGSDSRSYFGFTNGVWTEFYFSINEKRRYLYPIFMLPISLLPGSALRATAWIQAGLGVLTILPFAYIVRRIFVGWKGLIVPLTVLYAGLPVYIWYEHELIADTILFDGVVWMLAGWMAWVSQADRARAARLWWWFFVPLAIIALTKPSVKFFWPGILFALVVVGAWRVLRWKHWAALGALFVVGLTVGDEDQGAWLLMNTAFPFVQLETPLHAPYKAEIRDWVLQKRARIDFYAEEDYEVQKYFRGPGNDPARPLWRKLAKDKAKLSRVYRDIALEAIRARPDLFVKIGLHRLLGSCNPADLDDSRFRADYFSKRLEEQIVNHRNPESMLRIAFGIPFKAPFPSVEEFRAWTNPRGECAASAWMQGYVGTYQRLGALVTRPGEASHGLDEYRPTLLGWWVLLGGLLACFPPFLRTVGVWGITMASAMAATYLVGIEHHRYFAVTWPVVLLALAVGVDGLVRLAGKVWPRGRNLVGG